MNSENYIQNIKLKNNTQQVQKQIFLLYKFIYLFYILFLAVLGLCCCTQAFSISGEQGLLFVVAVYGLNAVASLVAEHGL